MAVVENNNHVEQNDVSDQSKLSVSKANSNDHENKTVMTPNGNNSNEYQTNDQSNKIVMSTNGVSNNKNYNDHEEEEGFKKDMRDLAEMLSKLNPMAAEFVPPSLANNSHIRPVMVPASPVGHFGYAAVNNFLLQTNNAAFANVSTNGGTVRRVYSILACLFSFVFVSYH